MDNQNQQSQPTDHTNHHDASCSSCAHKSIWMHKSPIRIFIGFIFVMFIFTAGVAVGHMRSGFMYGMHNQFYGRGAMMRGYQNRQPIQVQPNNDGYTIPNGMMRVRGATNTNLAPGQIQNY